MTTIPGMPWTLDREPAIPDEHARETLAGWILCGESREAIRTRIAAMPPSPRRNRLWGAFIEWALAIVELDSEHDPVEAHERPSAYSR